MQSNNNLNLAHQPTKTEPYREISYKPQQQRSPPQRQKYLPAAESERESKKSVTSFYADGKDFDLNGSKDYNQNVLDTMSDSDEEAKFIFE